MASFLSFLLGEKKKTASVAKERLQIILAHERSGRGASRADYLRRVEEAANQLVQERYLLQDRGWTFDPKTWQHNPEKMHFGFGANRGVAYAHGRIFAAAQDGRLFALDARTGKQVWVVETTDPAGMVTPPTLFGSKLGSPVGTGIGSVPAEAAVLVRSRSWSMNWPQA